MMRNIIERGQSILKRFRKIGKESTLTLPELTGERPYEVSNSAVSQLLSWGADMQYVDNLVRMGNCYSYAHPEEKLASILSGDIIAHGTPVDSLTYNKSILTDPTLPFGECSELARRIMLLGHVLELWTPVRKDSVELSPLLVGGYSPTHFNQGEARHFWVGILPKENYKDNLQSMVVHDPSFRRITTLGESGYSIDTMGSRLVVDPTLPKNTTYAMDHPTALLATHRLIHRIHPREKSSLVLGVTKDYQFTVNLLACNINNSGKINAAITLHQADGAKAFSAILDPSGQSLRIACKEGRNIEELGEYTHNIESMLRLVTSTFDKINASIITK